jgi:hypothetical protein
MIFQCRLFSGTAKSPQNLLNRKRLQRSILQSIDEDHGEKNPVVCHGLAVSAPILDLDLGLALQPDNLLGRVFLPCQFLAPWRLKIVSSLTLKVGKFEAADYVCDRK